MNLVLTTLLSALPSNRKTTPGGWTSINSPCCNNRGHRRDIRHRGGLIIHDGGDGFVFNCLNCGFRAGWKPGKMLSSNSRSLFKWLGVADDTISKLVLFCLKHTQGGSTEFPILEFELAERALPNGCVLMSQLLDAGYDDPAFLACVDYLQSRGMHIDWYPWQWTDLHGYQDRVILPFYHDHKIVGWTGRKVGEGRPKYLTNSQPGYVFNLAAQPLQRKYCIVTEGQFDAIAIDGVAIMHNDPSEVQCARINNLGREVIVVPDRDAAGARMLGAALKHGWSVSMPPWSKDIKDVADAQQKYGRLYTLHTIIHYRQTNSVKIHIMKKQLEKLT